MKLYVLDVMIWKKESYFARSVRGPLSYRNRTIAKFPLTMEGLTPFESDGTWTTTDAGTLYLGQSDGFWRTRPDVGGWQSILLTEESEPNIISMAWRSEPFILGFLEGIPRLPLSLGETGSGDIRTQKTMPENIFWKVADRGF